MNNRVLLGMSGGVDSSVSALLLKNQGYDVVGMTMKLTNDEIEGGCCSFTSTLDAKKVCNSIDIPHYTIDFTKEFRIHVIDNFIESYRKCVTPNPCIECNRYLKFGHMYRTAMELDCEYIATGHYAITEYSEEYGQYVLKKRKALKKDQSYVLWNIPQKMISKLILPLGKYNDKSEIRKIAAENGLKVANKPDSEDICFIPDGDYSSYLTENSDIMSEKGRIVTEWGETVGTHNGLFRYTIGQRKGLGVSYKFPLYVTGFDIKENVLIVGADSDLFSCEFYGDDVNWLAGDIPQRPISANVKVRYSSKEYPVSVIPTEKGLKFVSDVPIRAVTPGQSAVIYKDDIVLGGSKII